MAITTLVSYTAHSVAQPHLLFNLAPPSFQPCPSTPLVLIFLPCAGEKPFDTVEDLVQDGLITLYMEANDVEDYLQSARQTRLVHQVGSNGNADPLDLTPMQGDPAHTVEESVFNGDALSAQVKDLSVREASGNSRPRKQVYQPCTIPQQRDRTNVQLHGKEEGLVESVLSMESEPGRGEKPPLSDSEVSMVSYTWSLSKLADMSKD